MIKNFFNSLSIKLENIDENNIQSLSMLYKNVTLKSWLLTSIWLSSCAIGLFIGWITKSMSLMMIFVCISMLAMFKWTEIIQHKVRLHRNIVNIASNRGELSYDEVLVNLDILGASVRLTKSAYKSYCRHWNFLDDFFRN